MLGVLPNDEGTRTMDAVLGTALSGLRAAETRSNVAASNIVNQRSDAPMPAAGGEYRGYAPLRVNQSAQAPGTLAVLSPIDPAYVPLPDGEGNMRATPNVDLTANVVDLGTAEQAYKASAAVIRVQDAMSKDMLDILS
jgi:flagellar basal body rod protein FlgC